MIARPMDITPINPLYVPIGKAVMVAVLEDVIVGLEQAPVVLDPDDQFEEQLRLTQHREFLAWVRGQPGPNIDMAMYPAPGTVLDFTGAVLN